MFITTIHQNIRYWIIYYYSSFYSSLYFSIKYAPYFESIKLNTYSPLLLILFICKHFIRKDINVTVNYEYVSVSVGYVCYSVNNTRKKGFLTYMTTYYNQYSDTLLSIVHSG